MTDRAVVKEKLAEWLDGQEGFAIRRERLHDDIEASPERVLAWLEAAFVLGMESAAKTDDRSADRALDEWVMDRRNWAEAVRNFPDNTCPASRHVHMIADALADEGKYPIIEEDPAHVAGSLYGAIAALWEARAKIAELEERLGTRPDFGAMKP